MTANSEASADNRVTKNPPHKRHCTLNNHQDAMPSSLMTHNRVPSSSNEAMSWKGARIRQAETHLNIPWHPPIDKEKNPTPDTDPPPSFEFARPPSKRLRRFPAHLTTDYILPERLLSSDPNKDAEGTHSWNKRCQKRKKPPLPESAAPHSYALPPGRPSKTTVDTETTEQLTSDHDMAIRPPTLLTVSPRDPVCWALKRPRSKNRLKHGSRSPSRSQRLTRNIQE
jgi:hypothetical protein